MQQSSKHHDRTRPAFRIVWRAALCATGTALALLAWFAAPASAIHPGLYGAGSRVIACSDHFPAAVFATKGRYVILPTSSWTISDVIEARKQYETRFGDIELPPPRVVVPFVDSATEREALYIRFAACCSELNLVTNVIAMTSADKRWLDPRAHVSTSPAGSTPKDGAAVVVSRELASAVLALLTVPFLCEAHRTMKRRRWRRTGRCGVCGYALAGLDDKHCPECGWTA